MATRDPGRMLFWIALALLLASAGVLLRVNHSWLTSPYPLVVVFGFNLALTAVLVERALVAFRLGSRASVLVTMIILVLNLFIAFRSFYVDWFYWYHHQPIAKITVSPVRWY